MDGHEKHVTILKNWGKQKVEQLTQLSVEFDKKLYAPQIRLNDYLADDYASFTVCQTSNVLFNFDKGEFAHPQILIDVVHAGEESYLEYRTRRGRKVLELFLEPFNFEYEVWDGEFHERW